MGMRTDGNESVFEFAILARLTWNLHSLNNEGTLGNVTEPRTVILWDGQRSDGISGEMMKHIHAYWSWLGASSADDYELCDGCRNFRPQRADLVSSKFEKNDKAESLNVALQCTLCDIHGFLVQRPTIHRPSVVEFGWVVGVPGKIQRDLHTHARHAATERGVEEPAADTEGGTTQDQAVAAQMVYHRPTRSGVYAFVSLCQPWRIGLNEIAYTYAIDHEKRKRRLNLVVQAYEWTLKRPDGAMRSTRLPHIEKAEGLILVSKQPVPVPLVSPLRDDFREKAREIAIMQNCEIREFADLDELTRLLQEAQDWQPYELIRKE
jgi:CRISPR-associated protein Cst2